MHEDSSASDDSFPKYLQSRIDLSFSRGCITPKIVENLVEALVGKDGNADDIDDTVDAIDGWEDMSDEWKEKILTMLKDGHVPDEDWKGVSTLAQVIVQS